MARRYSKRSLPSSDAEVRSVPPGAPDWVTADLIEKTIRVWQPYYADPLTPEDALAIIQSVGRLIEVFSEEETAP